MHDGASHSRTDKVKVISNWQIGCQNIRVCWEGDLKDRNCCKCEKCLRTNMNFIATNKTIPSCLSNKINLKEALKKIILKNAATKAEWQQIYDYTHKNSPNSPWLRDIAKVIKRVSLKDRLFPQDSLRKKSAKRVKRLISSR